MKKIQLILISAITINYAVAEEYTTKQLSEQCQNAKDVAAMAQLSTWGILGSTTANGSPIKNIQQAQNNIYLNLDGSNAACKGYAGSFCSSLDKGNQPISVSLNKAMVPNYIGTYLEDKEIKSVIICGAHYNNLQERGVHWTHQINIQNRPKAAGFIAISYDTGKEPKYEIITNLN